MVRQHLLQSRQSTPAATSSRVFGMTNWSRSASHSWLRESWRR